jgi:hypothetical protein
MWQQGGGSRKILGSVPRIQRRGRYVVDLMDEPYIPGPRAAAVRLYERRGFERRDSRLYRFTFDTAESPTAGSPAAAG